MRKILVVEPRRMLQQAITLSLIADHEVKLITAIPSGEAPWMTEYDALVIDAAALREQNGLSGQMVQNLLHASIPIIWIENSDIELAPKRDKVVVVKEPIEKKTLLLALAQCLQIPTASTSGSPSAQRKTTKGSSKSPRRENKTGVAAKQPGSQVIELVDVVEEGPANKSD